MFPTVQMIDDRAGLAERYVREWLASCPAADYRPMASDGLRS
jgi:hypothetical protein